MVLLKANQNRDIGNKSFDEKKKIFGTFGYLITQQVARYDSWALKEIRERRAELRRPQSKRGGLLLVIEC